MESSKGGGSRPSVVKTKQPPDYEPEEIRRMTDRLKVLQSKASACVKCGDKVKDWEEGHILRCLHVLCCRKCLDECVFAIEGHDEGGGKIYECPFPNCKVKTELDKLAAWKEIGREIKFKEGFLYCTYCILKKDTMYWCPDCLDSLCQQCGREHIGMRRNLLHKLSLFDLSLTRRVPVYCGKHADTPAKSFCQDCNVEFCKDGLCPFSHSGDGHTVTDLSETKKTQMEVCKQLLREIHVSREGIKPELLRLEGEREKVVGTLQSLTMPVKSGDEPIGKLKERLGKMDSTLAFIETTSILASRYEPIEKDEFSIVGFRVQTLVTLTQELQRLQNDYKEIDKQLEGIYNFNSNGHSAQAIADVLPTSTKPDTDDDEGTKAEENINEQEDPLPPPIVAAEEPLVVVIQEKKKEPQSVIVQEKKKEQESVIVQEKKKEQESVIVQEKKTEQESVIKEVAKVEEMEEETVVLEIPPPPAPFPAEERSAVTQESGTKTTSSEGRGRRGTERKVVEVKGKDETVIVMSKKNTRANSTDEPGEKAKKPRLEDSRALAAIPTEEVKHEVALAPEPGKTQMEKEEVGMEMSVPTSAAVPEKDESQDKATGSSQTVAKPEVKPEVKPEASVGVVESRSTRGSERSTRGSGKLMLITVAKAGKANENEDKPKRRRLTSPTAATTTQEKESGGVDPEVEMEKDTTTTKRGPGRPKKEKVEAGKAPTKPTKSRKSAAYEPAPVLELTEAVEEINMKISSADDDMNEDFCAVCYDGGEDLICCDHCPKIVHKECHLPSMTAVPEDDWRCMFCTTKEDLPDIEFKIPRKEIIKVAAAKLEVPSNLSRGKFLYACKFLTEIYKMKESTLLLGDFEGTPNINLHLIRTKLTLGKPTNYRGAQEIVPLMEKMFEQARAFYQAKGGDNLKHIDRLEATYREILPVYFPYVTVKG